jgi:uncharacterized protein YodC (DUF2158 family)
MVEQMFEPGDFARLKSGGPRMLVTDILPDNQSFPPRGSAPQPMIKCIWFTLGANSNWSGPFTGMFRSGWLKPDLQEPVA